MPIFYDEFAAVAPRFSGGASFISSHCIIYIIYRSKAKFSTVYHRIMFAMSVADIISSLAMGLTTIPMPKDWVDPRPYNAIPYDWAGIRLGNALACKVQGFCIVFGYTVMFSYNGWLCVYYACSIALKVKEKSLELLVFHLLPLSQGIFVALPALLFDGYNPNGYEQAWCTLRTFSEYPHFSVSYRYTYVINIMSVSIFLATVIISFVLIIWKMIQVERLLEKSFKRRSTRSNSLMNDVQRSHDNTKVILVQAIAYVSVFLITTTPAFIHTLLKKEPQWLVQLHLILFPLQGFFNALIFISHKIYNYRRTHPDVSPCTVLQSLFRGDLDEPVALSRISIVQKYHDDEHDEEILKIDIEDEENNVKHLCFFINENLDGIEQKNDNESVSEHTSGKEMFDDNDGSRENLSGFSSFDQFQQRNHAHSLSHKSSNDHDRDVTGYSSRDGLSGFSSISRPMSTSSSNPNAKDKQSKENSLLLSLESSSKDGDNFNVSEEVFSLSPMQQQIDTSLSQEDKKIKSNNHISVNDDSSHVMETIDRKREWFGFKI
jgi:hypothetical protein